MKERGRIHWAHVHAVHRAKAFAFNRWVQHVRIQIAHRALVVTNLQRVVKRYSLVQHDLARLHLVLIAVRFACGLTHSWRDRNFLLPVAGLLALSS